MDTLYQGTVHSTNFVKVEEGIPHFSLKLDPEGMETAEATVENSVCVCVCELLSRVRLFATAMDFSLLGFSVQTRILEWVAISFSRGSS